MPGFSLARPAWCAGRLATKSPSILSVVTEFRPCFLCRHRNFPNCSPPAHWQRRFQLPGSQAVVLIPGKSSRETCSSPSMDEDSTELTPLLLLSLPVPSVW